MRSPHLQLACGPLWTTQKSTISCNSLLFAGNKLQSLDDVQQLQQCTSLVMLDLSSNRITTEAAVHLVASLPLSLLKLNGNPAISQMR